MVLLPSDPIPRRLFIFSFCSMPLIALIIWLGALETDCLLRHWLSLKPCLLLGQVSFTVYILQGCVNTYSGNFIGPWLSRQFGLSLDYDYVFFFVLNAIGVVIHFMFEQPAYNALLSLGSRNSNQRPCRKSIGRGRRRTLNTLVSNEWVQIAAYYVLMLVSIGGYGKFFETALDIQILCLALCLPSCRISIRAYANTSPPCIPHSFP